MYCIYTYTCIYIFCMYYIYIYIYIYMYIYIYVFFMYYYIYILSYIYIYTRGLFKRLSEFVTVGLTFLFAHGQSCAQSQYSAGANQDCAQPGLRATMWRHHDFVPLCLHEFVSIVSLYNIYLYIW